MRSRTRKVLSDLLVCPSADEAGVPQVVSPGPLQELYLSSSLWPHPHAVLPLSTVSLWPHTVLRPSSAGSRTGTSQLRRNGLKMACSSPRLQAPPGKGLLLVIPSLLAMVAGASNWGALEARDDRQRRSSSQELRLPAYTGEGMRPQSQQRLQQSPSPMAFPTASKAGYRTPTTCLFFQSLWGNVEDKTHLVALMGIEPMFQP
jgi:hypothetical protein